MIKPPKASTVSERASHFDRLYLYLAIALKQKT